MQEIHYVYALYDPLDKNRRYRYIGKTKRPEGRLQQHIKSQKNPLLRDWIKKMIDKGREPKITLLGSGDKFDIVKMESDLIKEYGSNMLKNIVHNKKNSIENLHKIIRLKNYENQQLRTYMNQISGIKGFSKIINKANKYDILLEKYNALKNKL